MIATRRFQKVRAARRTVLSSLLVGVALLTPGCNRRDQTDGNSAPQPAGDAITRWTDSVELFMEHPALIVGDSLKFAVHLTDVTDFAPLRAGKITLRFVPQTGGASVVSIQDGPRSPGIFGPVTTFAAAGVYDLTLIVNSAQAKDSLTIRDLRVYATSAEAPKEAEGGEGGIPFLKEQQWKTPGFRTAFAATGTVSSSIEAPGQIMPTAGGLAEVSAPISGLIDVASLAQSPAPGQTVSRGQVLAVINPTLGEGGANAYAEARARLQEAEDESARAKRLVDAEAVPARRLHEAEIRLRAAKEALSGLGGAGGGIQIRSPISGVVTRRTATPGSRVEAGTSLFTVIDPSVVWLTANVAAGSAPLVNASSPASFRVEGAPRVYAARRVVSIGSVVDPISRTVPVIYEVPNADRSIRVGSTAQVTIHTATQVEGVVIPSGAILDEEGRSIAYVQPSGERFEKREVVIGGAENGRVLVKSGIRAGERVVVGAPYQVRLASLSTSVPAHGHAH